MREVESSPIVKKLRYVARTVQHTNHFYSVRQRDVKDYIPPDHKTTYLRGKLRPCPPHHGLSGQKAATVADSIKQSVRSTDIVKGNVQPDFI